MKVYVVYSMSDYAHALAITTNYEAAEQYQNELINHYGNRYTWIDDINVNEQITELDYK